ncbi:MAG: nucleotidyltransferase family protein [Beijerinckiaceae bacterium]
MTRSATPGFMPSKAMVFAAGLGKRMRPITETTPKPLVEVGGKALIDHMLDRYAEAGVAEAVVNVHYLPDMIIEHLKGRSKPDIFISDERKVLLDQGGGIAKVLDRLGPDPFFICNTDAFWIDEREPNLQRMAQMWDPDKMDFLMLLARTAGSVGVDWPGDFFMDETGRLTRRTGIQLAPFVYAGVAIGKPALFAGEKREIFPLGPLFFEAAEKGRLYGMRLDGQWLHVGTPQALEEANHVLARLAA